MKSLQKGDQRSTPRVSVDILLNKYVKGRPYLCRASNFSRGGLLVHRIREPQNDETHIGLQFQLPGDDRVITCAGRVVFEHKWTDASGVRFTAIAPEHQQLIDEFLDRAERL
jgi:hypothetical protein